MTEKEDKIREARKSDNIFNMVNNIMAPIIQHGLFGIIHDIKKKKEKIKEI